MMDEPKNNNGWSKYQMYITETLTRQGSRQEDILKAIAKIDIRLSLQESKVKWIAVGVSSVVSAIIGLVMFIIRTEVSK